VAQTLYDRLQARGYADNKLQENMQCEIMQVRALRLCHDLSTVTHSVSLHARRCVAAASLTSKHLQSVCCALRLVCEDGGRPNVIEYACLAHS
jgi:broad-specificity NMP kinase